MPTAIEMQNRKAARKCIVAKCPIRKGEVFCEDNIAVKRAGDGISPMKWYQVLGKTADRDFTEEEPIEVSR